MVKNYIFTKYAYLPGKILANTLDLMMNMLQIKSML